jgi:hypothetical protein
MKSNHTNRYQHLALAACYLLITLLSGCATTAVDTRIHYWEKETSANLPIGSSKLQAQEFFKARSAELKCCVSAPPGPTFHLVHERKVGHGFLMEYDVVVLVEISNTDQVAAVKVQRWGLGL